MGCGPQKQAVFDRELVNIHKTVMKDTREFWLELNEMQEEFGLVFFRAFIQANRSYKALFNDVEKLSSKLMKVVSLVFSNWENPVKRQGLMEVLGKLGQFHRKLGVPESAFPMFTTIFINVLLEMFPNVKMHVVKEVEHRFLKCCLNIVENYGKVGVNDGNQLTLEETQAALEAITNEELQKNDLDGLCDLSEEIAMDVNSVWRKISTDSKVFGTYLFDKVIAEEKQVAAYLKGGDKAEMSEKLLNIISLLFNSWGDKDQRAEMLDVLHYLGDMQWRVGILHTSYTKFITIFTEAVKKHVPNVPEHVIEDMELRLLKTAMSLLADYAGVKVWVDPSKEVHIDDVSKYAEKCKKRAAASLYLQEEELQKKRAAEIKAYEEEGIEGSDLEEAIQELDVDLGLGDRKLEDHQVTVEKDIKIFAEELENVREEFGVAFFESFLTENPSYQTLFRGSVDMLTEKLMEIVSMLFTKWNAKEGREQLFGILSRLGQLHRMLGVQADAFPKFTSCFIRQVMMQYPHIPGHVLKCIEFRFLKTSMEITKSYSVVGMHDENQYALGGTGHDLGVSLSDSDEEEVVEKEVQQVSEVEFDLSKL